MNPSTLRLENDLQTCLDSCLQCLVACELCATACLEEEDSQAVTRCIQLARLCRIMRIGCARNSPEIKFRMPSLRLMRLSLPILRQGRRKRFGLFLHRALSIGSKTICVLAFSLRRWVAPGCNPPATNFAGLPGVAPHPDQYVDTLEKNLVEGRSLAACQPGR